MPRPKPKTDKNEPPATPHRLSDKARQELLCLLGVKSDDSEAQDVLEQVERWLGFYSPATKAASNTPGAADYRIAAIPLLAQSVKLEETIDALHSWIKTSLDQKMRSHIKYPAEEDIVSCAAVDRAAQDLEGTQTTLRILQSAAQEILEEVSGKENRGRPRKRFHLIGLIDRLRIIFMAHYRGGSRERPDSLAIREYKEEEFITVALRDASIQVPDEIRRLISSSPLSKRDALIEKMSTHVHERYQGSKTSDDPK